LIVGSFCACYCHTNRLYLPPFNPPKGVPQHQPDPWHFLIFSNPTKQEPFFGDPAFCMTRAGWPWRRPAATHRRRPCPSCGSWLVGRGATPSHGTPSTPGQGPGARVPKAYGGIGRRGTHPISTDISNTQRVVIRGSEAWTPTPKRRGGIS